MMKRSDMPNERIGELLRHLFAILSRHPKGLYVAEVFARLKAAVKLKPSEVELYESTGTPRFEARLGFATSYCVSAGWLTKKRHGRWRATPAGIAAWRELRDPEQFLARARQIHNASRVRERMTQHGAEPASPPETMPANPTETVASGGLATISPPTEEQAIDTARGAAWGEIERHLTTMDAYVFQRLVADLLRAMGWDVPWEAPPGPDGGVDIIAFRDPLGASGGRLKVQVKSGTTRVRSDAVRAFAATVNEEEAGLFVAAGGFTDDAVTFARLQARDRLMLIDLPRLVELWARHYARLDVEARRRLPMAPVWFLTTA